MTNQPHRDAFLAAINSDSDSRPVCSFMMYKGLLSSSKDYLEFLEKQLALGLTPYALIPPRPPIVNNDYYNLHGMPVSFDQSVEVKEWVEERESEKFPVMVKEYHTPEGVLRAEVRQTEDWRWGNHIPLFDDYISPRAIQFIIKDEEDLPALGYLLADPTAEDIDKTRQESEPVLNFAKDHGLPVVGGWGVGADMLGWIYGFEKMVFASLDQPDFLRKILRMIADWNQKRMQILIDMGIDLYIKRTWYETCNFWSPKTFKEFIFPILKEDIDLCHASGVKFGCYATDRAMPILKYYAEAGLDVLIGVDPHTYDLERTAEILGGKVCLWGGVNGHLTIELGTEDEAREEVRRAMDTLGKNGGLILSPVDNVREDTPTSRRNVRALIDEWERLNRRG